MARLVKNKLGIKSFLSSIVAEYKKDYKEGNLKGLRKLLQFIEFIYYGLLLVQALVAIYYSFISVDLLKGQMVKMFILAFRNLSDYFKFWISYKIAKDAGAESETLIKLKYDKNMALINAACVFAGAFLLLGTVVGIAALTKMFSGLDDIVNIVLAVFEALKTLYIIFF